MDLKKQGHRSGPRTFGLARRPGCNEATQPRPRRASLGLASCCNEATQERPPSWSLSFSLVFSSKQLKKGLEQRGSSSLGPCERANEGDNRRLLFRVFFLSSHAR